MQRTLLITATTLLEVHDKIEASRVQALAQRDMDEVSEYVRALREREQNEKELADAIEQNHQDFETRTEASATE
jgi:signal transduction histidine kinase